NARLFTLTTVTITDDADVGPDGKADASRVVGTSAWKIVPKAGTWPAGTYTVALSAKRNTGSDQPFALSDDNAATRDVKTATAVWQRFTHTFTKATTFSQALIAICSSDGSTGADILIRDFDIYPGAADLGASTPDGNVYYGLNPYAAPTVA